MQGARGEGSLEIEGRRYALLFTNRALAEGEKATGKSTLLLLRSLETMELGIGDLAQLLYVGMEYGRREARAGGRSYTINDAFRILDALGFAQVASAVVQAVVAVLSYGQGEAEDGERPAEDPLPEGEILTGASS